MDVAPMKNKKQNKQQQLQQWYHKRRGKTKQTNEREEVLRYGHFSSWYWESQKSERHIPNLLDKCTDSRNKFM